jgi:hypothetical protein
MFLVTMLKKGPIGLVLLVTEKWTNTIQVIREWTNTINWRLGLLDA